MKSILLFLIFAPAVMFNADLGSISKALSSGDAQALGQYFDQSVEVSILDDEDLYSRAEAISIVKDFFSKNKPNSFSQLHKGASKGKDSEYCIGLLSTSTHTFKVYLYMKVSADSYLIQGLRFDRE
ncbi:MAG: DUF4783 domain-containing protein [Bacteroidetes bacterium]|nr:DUF4783 domain-containing protein [Bacteroidota bacterium]